MDKQVLDRPTNWKPGKADEAWKVLVAAKSYNDTRDVLTWISYILDNPGMCTDQEHANVIRRFTGDQIADALLKKMESSYRSIENGLGGDYE